MSSSQNERTFGGGGGGGGGDETTKGEGEGVKTRESWANVLFECLHIFSTTRGAKLVMPNVPEWSDTI